MTSDSLLNDLAENRIRCVTLVIFEKPRGLLYEQVFKRDSGEYAGDRHCSRPIAVGIGHAAQAFAEVPAEGAFNGGADGRSLGWRVNHVAGTLTALLAHSDVDHGQTERCGFHNAAG